MQEDAYIVLYNLDEELEFTVELLPQTEYKAFNDNSGLLGFFPVGLAVEEGQYELDTEFSFPYCRNSASKS
ncbi:hypothetical protein RZE82_03630 [Mollicutes bacterium LVI A0039]|nr:hypothetical protein RZE82_03630 [Mollicutes bacterium LVI A0039]